MSCNVNWEIEENHLEENKVHFFLIGGAQVKIFCAFKKIYIF